MNTLSQDGSPTGPIHNGPSVPNRDRRRLERRRMLFGFIAGFAVVSAAFMAWLVATGVW
jgi:hypothetical protein